MDCEAGWLWVPDLTLSLCGWEALVFSSLKWADGSGNLLYDAGSSDQVFGDHLEGVDRMGGGRELQEEGNFCIPRADSH